MVEEEGRKEYKGTARGIGWKLTVQPCVIGEKGGVFAGTAIGCKKHIGLSNHGHADIDAWLELKGSFSTKRVGAVCEGGGGSLPMGSIGSAGGGEGGGGDGGGGDGGDRGGGGATTTTMTSGVDSRATGSPN